MKKAILSFVFYAFGNAFVYAQDFDFDIKEGKDDVDYHWKTPAGKYLEPTSFFSLHGYVNGVYATESKDWTAFDPTQIQAPGQLLVPNTPKSSFQYDFALIFASELTKRTRLALETHYVSAPSGNGAAGPGGITIAITEAAGSFDLIPKHLTISAGIFWSPFGIINADWLGAQNNFSLLPRASGAYPVHYNERGIRVNGFVELVEDFAINYVVSYGNGLSNWSINGQSSYDNNNDKTITGRLGVYPGLGKDLEIGFSYMNGQMRDVVDASLDPVNSLRYVSASNAMGVDLVYKKSIIEFRGYGLMSVEALEDDNLGNTPSDLDRMGYMGELLVNIKVGLKGLQSIKPKVRYDHVSVNQLELDDLLEVVTQEYNSVTYSAGINFLVNDNFRFSFDYNIIEEVNYGTLDNDRFIGKLIAQF